MAKGIYKRGKVYWIRYAGLDGRVIRESTGSAKFKDAQDLLIERKQSVRDGKQPEIKRIARHTFSDLAEEYVKWAVRQRSFRQKLNYVKHLTSEFGHYPLRSFTTKLLEHYQTERLNIGNKPASVNRYVATIKHMFTKAVEWEMVEDSVLKKVRRVKMLEENNRRPRYLTKDECRTLVDACDEHLKPIVIMALYTGMRKGEILNLKWDNVDMRHGFILLEMTKN